MEVLARALRPQTFAEVIGQAHIIDTLNKQFKADRLPRAFLFEGPPGNGKTTLMKILGLSLQVPHRFGAPMAADWAAFKSFSIREENAADVGGVEDIRALIKEAQFGPPPGSKVRVFILDEAHKLSSAAQEALLIPVENCSPDTAWIFGSSAPQKLGAALKRRLTKYALTGLNPDDIEILVKKAASFAGYNGKLDPFFAAIADAGLNSPGVILDAFTLIIDGMPPRRAVKSAESSIEYVDAARAFVAGDSKTVRAFLRSCDTEAAKGFRLMLLSWLKTTMLSGRTQPAANAILALSGPVPYDDTFFPWFAATLMIQVRNFKQV